MEDKKPFTMFEFVILCIFAAIFYFLFNIDKLFDYISGNDDASKTYFFDQINTYSDSVLTFLGDRILTPSVGTFLLWGIIGIVSYVVIALFSKQLQELLEAIRNDKEYVHPKNYSRTKFWTLLIASAAVSGVSFVLLVWWLAFSLNTLGTFAAESLSNALFFDLSLLDAALQILLGYAAVLLALVGFRLIITLSRYLHRLLS